MGRCADKEGIQKDGFFGEGSHRMIYCVDVQNCS